jgi:hypothetical protein
MFVGLFLLSGDHGGIEQKNRVRSNFYQKGLCRPQEEEVLHDTFKDTTEFSLTQTGLRETRKERIESPISIE